MEGREEFVEKWQALLAEQMNMALLASDATPAMHHKYYVGICHMWTVWRGGLSKYGTSSVCLLCNTIIEILVRFQLGYNTGMVFPAVIVVWCLRVQVRCTNLLTRPTPCPPSRFHGF